jgi:hypothetical protein
MLPVAGGVTGAGQGQKGAEVPYGSLRLATTEFSRLIPVGIDGDFTALQPSFVIVQKSVALLAQGSDRHSIFRPMPVI